MKAQEYEVTLKNGTRVYFKATRLEARPGQLIWGDVTDAYPQLVKLVHDEVAAIVRIK